MKSANKIRFHQQLLTTQYPVPILPKIRSSSTSTLNTSRESRTNEKLRKFSKKTSLQQLSGFLKATGPSHDWKH